MQSDVGQAWDPFSAWDDCLAAQREAALHAARRAAVLPAYRDAWLGCGFDPAAMSPAAVSIDDWQRLPMLSKGMLIDSAKRAPPFGGRLGVNRAELAHLFVAPGPLYMPFTAADLTHVAGSFAKALSACGLRQDDVVDQTTMYNWVIAATSIDRALQMIGCCVIPGGIGQTERHLEAIGELGVNAIVAFPTFLEHLLTLAAEKGQHLPLRKAVIMGELSSPGMKTRFRAEHGLEVREFYGAADVGAIAWECEAGCGMHLRDDLLVEFLTPGRDTAVLPGPGSPAELVVTDFHRRAMPIIRLRTGDLVDEVVSGPCSCGRSAPRISRIVGRTGEITKVKGMFVVPRLVQDVLRAHGISQRFRLVVDRLEGGRDELSLELEAGREAPPEQLKADVEKALRMRITLALVDSLPEGGTLLVDRRAQNQGA